MTLLEAEAVAAVFVDKGIPVRAYKLPGRYGFGVAVDATPRIRTRLTNVPTPEEIGRIILMGTHGASDEADPDREILRATDSTGAAALPLPGRGSGFPTDE